MAKPAGEVIAHCPKCGKPIGDQNPYAWCMECGEALTPEIKAKIPLLVRREQEAQEKQRRAQQASPAIATQTISSISGQGNGAVLTGASSRVSALSRRYNDAYLVAKITVGLGNTIKIVGIVLAILIFLGVLMFATMAAGQAGGVFFVAMLVGGFYAFVTGFIFYFVGVIVSAQGQVLQATPDNTVGNSPFLEDEQKAAIMSLPA